MDDSERRDPAEGRGTGEGTGLHERALAALFSHLQHAGGRRRDLHRQRGMPRSKLWFICLQVSISGYVQGKYVKPMTRLILS